MSNAVKEVSRAGQAFEAKESAPPVAGIYSLQENKIASLWGSIYTKFLTLEILV